MKKTFENDVNENDDHKPFGESILDVLKSTTLSSLSNFSTSSRVAEKKRVNVSLSL